MQSELHSPILFSRRRWYISIVPMNDNPGTNNDVDFYAVPAHIGEARYPPEEGWFCVEHGGGVDPPPTLTGDP